MGTTAIPIERVIEGASAAAWVLECMASQSPQICLIRQLCVATRKHHIHFVSPLALKQSVKLSTFPTVVMVLNLTVVKLPCIVCISEASWQGEDCRDEPGCL